VRILSVVAVLLVYCVCSDAQPAMPPELPCLPQACAGAPLSSVVSLPWEAVPVADAASVVDDDMARIRVFVRAPEQTLRSLASYWSRGAFDAEGLDLLQRVDAVCQDLGVWMRPRASYVDGDGRRVTAAFEAVPTEDGEGQHFRIATLSVVHDPAMPDDAVVRMGREIARRYTGVPFYPNELRAGVQWLPRAAEGPTLRLFAPLAGGRQRDLARHPACLAD
jgi:hypothetical protein